MSLVEEGDDFVASLEAVDVAADGFNNAGAVGGGDNVVLDGEGVFTLRDDEVAVVEGGALDWGFGQLGFSNFELDGAGKRVYI